MFNFKIINYNIYKSKYKKKKLIGYQKKYFY